jgi:hypothetical protein
MKAVEDPPQEDQQLDEVGWWYGERTLTGLLAGAVWRRPASDSWWALEEFTSKRTGKRLAANAKLKKKSGRGDLWLGLEWKDDEHQFGFTIEAKETSAGKDKKQAVASIANGLLDARSQLRKVQKSYRHGLPLAICYYWPAFAIKSPDRHHPVPECFFKIAQEFREPDTMVAIRWCNYKRAPTPDAWIHPGVIMVGRIYRGWPGWSQSGLE